MAFEFAYENPDWFSHRSRGDVEIPIVNVDIWNLAFGRSKDETLCQTVQIS